MKMKEKPNALKNEAFELSDEGLEQVSGGGEPGTDTSTDFENLLDKATYPGTDYIVIRVK